MLDPATFSCRDASDIEGNVRCVDPCEAITGFLVMFADISRAL